MCPFPDNPTHHSLKQALLWFPSCWVTLACWGGSSRWNRSTYPSWPLFISMMPLRFFHDICISISWNALLLMSSSIALQIYKICYPNPPIFSPFLIELISLFLLDFVNSLYIQDTIPILTTWSANIFLPLSSLSFHLFNKGFTEQYSFILVRSNVSIFPVMDYTVCVNSENSLLTPRFLKFSPAFFSKSFIISHFTFMSIFG